VQKINLRGSPCFLPYYPIGGGADDWPAMLAALAVATTVGVPLMLMATLIDGVTASAIQCKTAPTGTQIPNNAKIVFADGAHVISSLAPVDGHTSTPFFRDGSNGAVVVTTLASAVVQGTELLSLVTSVGIAIGNDLILSASAELFAGYTVQALGVGLVGTQDFTAAGLYGGGGALDGESLILNVNGAGAINLPLAGGGNSASEAALLASIRATWPALTVQVGGSTGKELVLLASTSIVVGAGTANANLGLAAPTVIATATVERPILKPFPFGTSVEVSPGFPRNITIDGGGSGILSGTGDRGFQFVFAQDCRLQNLRINSSFTNFTASFDYGGLRCLHDSIVVTTVTGNPNGLAMEDGEAGIIRACTVYGIAGVSCFEFVECEQCSMSDCLAESGQAGFTLTYEAGHVEANHGISLCRCRAFSCIADGFDLNYGAQVVLSNCTAQYCGGYGLFVLDTLDVEDANGRYLNNGLDGIYFNSPDVLRMQGTATANNGTAGGVHAGLNLPQSGATALLSNFYSDEPKYGINPTANNVTISVSGWLHLSTNGTGAAAAMNINVSGGRFNVCGLSVGAMAGGGNVGIYVTAASVLSIDGSKCLTGIFAGIYVDTGGTARVGTSVDVSATGNKFDQAGAGFFNFGTVQLNGAAGVALAFPDAKTTDHLQMTRKTAGGTPGFAPTWTVTAGTGFTVSGTALDTSTYDYRILS
jgi:hypothetical protein